MIAQSPRMRPAPWTMRREGARAWWLLPFIAFDWSLEWVAYALSNWTLLEVLDYLGRFSILVAVIFYFAGSGGRVKQRHYQAWQVINTAQGKGGSGGRIEALQELNADKVPLVGVDVSSAFLQGLELRQANLLRANFNSADLRNSRLHGADFTLANLGSSNFRSAILDHTKFNDADLRGIDLNSATLKFADLSGAMLDDADLQHADLTDIAWQRIRSIHGANIAGVVNAPPGFAAWAVQNGAIDQPVAEE